MDGIEGYYVLARNASMYLEGHEGDVVDGRYERLYIAWVWEAGLVWRFRNVVTFSFVVGDVDIFRLMRHPWLRRGRSYDSLVRFTHPRLCRERLLRSRLHSIECFRPEKSLTNPETTVRPILSNSSLTFSSTSHHSDRAIFFICNVLQRLKRICQVLAYWLQGVFSWLAQLSVVAPVEPISLPSLACSGIVRT